MEEVREVRTACLVKGEDLNHHQTLYAGRCVEWCTHAAYVTAQSCFAIGQPLVFMSIRSLSMRAPARLGEVIEFIGRVDYIGESTIGVRVDARKMQPKDDQKPVATGTFLFCTVDEHGKALPHGLPQIAGQSRSAEKRWKATEESFAASLT
ncbi:MAG TPA: acyl-CoA thioesterase [Phycisphaerae bacterium]|nr:acyl-CoA thioesterase [Phycisphaerae bacterium]